MIRLRSIYYFTNVKRSEKFNPSIAELGLNKKFMNQYQLR